MIVKSKVGSVVEPEVELWSKAAGFSRLLRTRVYIELWEATSKG